jgi:YbbR domain-containing protein
MADNKKKSSFSLRKLIYNDKYLIIFSIFSAIVLWLLASINLSPEVTKTVTVPLNVDFSNSAAAQLGIKSYGQSKIDVDVMISCKKYVAKDITADDIEASLQTNTVTTNGNLAVPIKVDATRDDFTIKSYYPTTYNAYFDVEDSKTLDIDFKFSEDDFIADGYVMGEPLLSETSAKITGPKSYVSQVKKLAATCSITEKIDSTHSYDLTLKALDKSGNEVNYIKAETGSEHLTVTVPVLKETQLGVTTSFINVPGDVDTSKFIVSYSTEKVNAGVLEEANLKEANIGNIDFADLNEGNNEFTFDVTSLESMVILDDISEITAKVTVPSDYKTATVSVSSSNVTVTNVPDGYKANVISVGSSKVTVVGTESDLKKIKNGNIKLVIDLAAYDNKLEEGTNEYTITATVDNDGCWIYGRYTARLSVWKE